MRFILFTLFLSFILVAGMADAQVLPQKATGSILIADSSDDKIYRLTDLNLDGDFNDVDEVIDFYDGSASGLTLGNPTCVTVDHRGFIYVVDSSMEYVLRLYDLTGDGDANEPNEAKIWLDNTNASGVVLASPNTLVFNTDGTAYLSNAGDGGADADNIIYCTDNNADFDVNDAGEVWLFYDPLGAAPDIVMDLPQGLTLDGNGILYCVNPNTNGGYIVRLEDLGGDGNANSAGETTIFYDASGGGPAFTFAWTLARTHVHPVRDREGFLLCDTINDIMLIGYDDNDDDDLEDLDEMIIFRDKNDDPVLLRPGTGWGVQVSGFNTDVDQDFWQVYCADSSTPDAVIALEDKSDPVDYDARDTGECEEVYDENSSPVNITNPRAIGFMTGPWVERIGDPKQGVTVEYVLTSTQNDDYAFFLTTGTFSGFLVPPYGLVDILPPYLMLQQGTLPLTGTDSLFIKIPPNSPGIVGFKYYIKAIAGTDYLSILSNTVVNEILP